MNEIMAYCFGIMVLLGLIAHAIFKLKPEKTRCEKCSGVMDADPYHYKNIVVWTCRDCGDTRETLSHRNN